MTKNPLMNALSASLYIVLIASALFYAPRFLDRTESVMIPIVMLSLFVLSAAVMGFIFLTEPLRLFLDGKRKEATALFLKTVAIFACITIVLLFVWTYVSRVIS